MFGKNEKTVTSTKNTDKQEMPLVESENIKHLRTQETIRLFNLNRSFFTVDQMAVGVVEDGCKHS